DDFRFASEPIVVDTLASNGSHTLTAVVRDGAGNATTSAALTVTVANGNTVTRLEENSAAINYTGPWPHTLTIEVTRTKNPASSDYFVVVGAFDVTGAGPDTTPPTVSITLSAGTTAAGMTPVTASAADDTGVAGVRFLVDGVQ